MLQLKNIIILFVIIKTRTNSETVNDEMTDDEIKQFLEENYNRNDSINSSWIVEKSSDGIRIRHHTVRKRNNLTTSVTLLDELPVSDVFFADN